MLNSANNHQYNSPVGFQQYSPHVNSFETSPQFPDYTSPFQINNKE